MRKDDIIRMAKEAGMDYIEHISDESMKQVERFAQAAFNAGAAHEREACAKVADKWAVGWPHPSTVIAEEIRARKNK